MIGARLWRGGDDSPAPWPEPLRIRDGRIHAIGASALESSRPTEVIPLAGRYVIPGLIDAHVHLELDPRLRTPREQLAVPEPERARAMRARARSMLAKGITTVRDCGGGAFREHALRTEIDLGRSPGPRLLCCGQPVTPPEGHCAFWGGVAATPDQVERVVDRQLEAGSDWIKVMATGGVFTPGSRPRDLQFDEATLGRIVDRASRGGRPVAAHCHATTGIAAALRAGVTTIEHASFAGEAGFGTALDESLVDALAASATWVSPTVNGGWLGRISDADGEPSDFFRRMSRCLSLQHARGVRLIASTDAGIPGVFHHELAAGLSALRAYASMRPVDVLRAATSFAAEALGLAAETGRIEPGLSADLVVLAEDPTRDLDALSQPEAVVFRGRWLDGDALRVAEEAASG